MLKDIGDPVRRKDHDSKITGRELYLPDMRTASDGRPFLTGRLIRTEKAHAEILSIEVPELPEGYYFISGKDAPRNYAYYPLNDTEPLLTPEEAERIKTSMPLFADRLCEYAGQAVGMIAGPDEKTVRRLAAACRIEYRELPAVIRLEDAEESIVSYERSYGNYKAAFLAADFVYEETFSTGRQYQAYLETQGIMAEPQADGSMFIHGSMQCPFTVRESVAYALDISQESVRVRQDPIGGAFGGKEDFPSRLASQAAVAAQATGQPVRVIFDRTEDLQFNSKRHPSLTKVRAAVKNGRITAMDIDGKLDAGACLVSSGDVTLRYHTTFPGVYSIPNLHVVSRAMKTNTPPTGAFRGFGGPQAEFAMEMLLSHLAEELGVDELTFKKMHMAEKGKPSSTGGGYYFEVPLPRMIDMAEKATSYSEKRSRYDRIIPGRLTKGIGIAFANHGCPLGGDVEWKYIQPKVRLLKQADGSVEIFTSQTELGQGVRTAFCKIAACALEIPYEKVYMDYPDSDRTESTGITAASRSVVCVGRVVQEAAEELRRIWKDGEVQEVTAQMKKPEHQLPYDPIAMTGNQYDDYSWSVTVVEVLLDRYTGSVRITDAYGVYNLGTPIDENILRGQMEGGLLQALGYSAMERMVIGDSGRMFNRAFADYHVPTSIDIPDLRVEFERTPYPGGPFGAKGAGEIPLVGVSAAYLRAVEQAVRKIRPVKLTHIPFVPEDVLACISRR